MFHSSRIVKFCRLACDLPFSTFAADPTNTLRLLSLTALEYKTLEVSSNLTLRNINRILAYRIIFWRPARRFLVQIIQICHHSGPCSISFLRSPKPKLKQIQPHHERTNAHNHRPLLWHNSSTLPPDNLSIPRCNFTITATYSPQAYYLQYTSSAHPPEDPSTFVWVDVVSSQRPCWTWRHLCCSHCR